MKKKKPMRTPDASWLDINKPGDGNAFSIMGRVKQALKRAGADKEYIDEYLSKATSGDYDNLLVVSMGYVDVE